MTPELRHLCRIDAGLGAPMEMGQGRAGTRRIIPIVGGTVTGRIEGRVLNLGADWQLRRRRGRTRHPLRDRDP